MNIDVNKLHWQKRAAKPV